MRADASDTLQYVLPEFLTLSVIKPITDVMALHNSKVVCPSAIG